MQRLAGPPQACAAPVPLSPFSDDGQATDAGLAAAAPAVAPSLSDEGQAAAAAPAMSDEEVFSIFADGMMRLDRIVPAELMGATEEEMKEAPPHGHGHGHVMAIDGDDA